jgi:hypothetical protein
MFADILQDEYGRDLEEILQERTKTAEELLKQLWILSLI